MDVQQLGDLERKQRGRVAIRFSDGFDYIGRDPVRALCFAPPFLFSHQLWNLAALYLLCLFYIFLI